MILYNLRFLRHLQQLRFTFTSEIPLYRLSNLFSKMVICTNEIKLNRTKSIICNLYFLIKSLFFINIKAPPSPNMHRGTILVSKYSPHSSPIIYPTVIISNGCFIIYSFIKFRQELHYSTSTHKIKSCARHI